MDQTAKNATAQKMGYVMMELLVKEPVSVKEAGLENTVNHNLIQSLFVTRSVIAMLFAEETTIVSVNSTMKGMDDNAQWLTAAGTLMEVAIVMPSAFK